MTTIDKGPQVAGEAIVGQIKIAFTQAAGSTVASATFEVNGIIDSFAVGMPALSATGGYSWRWIDENGYVFFSSPSVAASAKRIFTAGELGFAFSGKASIEIISATAVSANQVCTAVLRIRVR